MMIDRSAPPALQLDAVSGRMLRNYVARYESGGVQPHPVTSFVDARGRACVVGAFAGARSLEEFASSEACRSFLDGPLVAISRLFEDGRVTPAEVYDACLVELAFRRVAAEREIEAAAAVTA
jgi:hypothetical protein